MIQVYKIGGNELDDPAFVSGLAQAVFASADAVVLVHGGGKAINQLQDRLGLPVQKVQGQRVTDLAALQVVEMVLCGQSNKLLVRALAGAGVPAVGISGQDGSLLRCEKLRSPAGDLGFVGRVTACQPAILYTLLENNFTPVVSPVSLSAENQPYNINADEAASAIAGALHTGLTFISNVPGVLQAGNVLPSLNRTQVAGLIAQGVITDGMIPKVQAALAALERGATTARLVNLAGLNSGGGTVFVRD
jgi:acetylglutamate kinase